MRYLFLVVTAWLMVCTAHAQNLVTVRGKVTDTADKATLLNASVTLTDAKDQFLIAYTRTNNTGAFRLPAVKPGSYMLTVSYPKYVDFIDVITLNPGDTVLALNKLNLQQQARMLKEVVIRGAAPVRIKGDTTEYAAKDYVIQPNSKVEDLVKQLPGMQVDKDGNITAQGQRVTRVLVDGEEFFGDDPKLVTRNVRGDMVDKVQMYDAQSDRAKATGVEDANKTRTLNITLKQDKKKGSFGNGEATIATNKYYTLNGFINGFTNKFKAAAFITASTLGEKGLSFSDLSNLGGRNMRFRGNNIVVQSTANDLADWDGNIGGAGLPTALVWGGHYDTKVIDNKLKLNLNYIGNDMKLRTENNTLQVRTLPGATQTDESDSWADKNYRRNSITGNFQYQLDSMTNLTVDIVGGLQNSGVRSSLQSSTVNDNNVRLNSTDRQVDNKGDGSTLNLNVFYSKRFSKPGRSISINIANARNTDNNDGYMLNTVTYNRNGQDSVTVTDQRKLNESVGNSFGASVTYSEPLASKLSMILDYELSNNNSRAKKLSYNKGTTGQYDVLDSLYSNDFKLNRLDNTGGLTLAYSNDPVVLRAGIKVSNSNYDQTDDIGGLNYKRNFLNYNPNANLRWKTSSSSFLTVNYDGNTSQPSVNQLQPVRQNNNPLNIVEGNPDLKPYFSNSFRMDYHSFNILDSRFINAGGSFNFTNNSIVNYTATDTLGASVQRYENLGGKTPYSYNAFVGINKQVRSQGLRLGVNGSFSGSKGYSYASSRTTGYVKSLNETSSANYSLTADIGKDKANAYALGLRIGPSYSVNKSSFSSGLNGNGWTYNAYLDATAYLPWKFEVATDADLTYRAATSAFPTPIHSYVWNAHIRKRFLKSEALIASVNAYDLLKQNIGFSRSAANGNITQTTNLVIQRYFSFSLKYEFNRMGGADAGPAPRGDRGPGGRPPGGRPPRG